MTWVMEEDTRAPVRENQGWKGGGNELFMRQNYTAFTFLNKLDQNPTFLKLLKEGNLCLCCTPHFQLLAAFIGRENHGDIIAGLICRFKK